MNHNSWESQRDDRPQRPESSVSNTGQNSYYVLLAILAGVLLPIQSAANAQLAIATRSVFVAALVNNLVGNLIIAVLLFTRQFGQINFIKARQAPWWSLLGGLFSVGYVVFSAYSTPLLGTALVMSLLIGGQTLMGFFVDGLGWFGIERRPLTRTRQIAILLIGIAVYLLIA